MWVADDLPAVRVRRYVSRWGAGNVTFDLGVETWAERICG